MDNLNNLYVPVRERIFTLLQSKAISQRDFAKAIKVSPQTITAWKMGENFSFMKKLSPIAKALGTSEVWLLTGKGTMQNSETIREVEAIADSAGIHPLDLPGIGPALDPYLPDVVSVSKKDGGTLSPEDSEKLLELLTSTPRSLYDRIDLEGKEQFFVILETDVLCQNIERYCKLKDILPETACKECGAGENFLQDIAKGVAPSVTKVQALAEYLGVTTSELLGERKPTPASGDGPDGAQHQIYKRLERLTPENLKKAEEYLDLLLMYQDKQDND